MLVQTSYGSLQPHNSDPITLNYQLQTTHSCLGCKAYPICLSMISFRHSIIQTQIDSNIVSELANKLAMIYTDRIDRIDG